MDRTTVNIAKSQIGFLDVIITPPFSCLSSVIDIQQIMVNIELNKEHWLALVDEYEEKMRSEKEKISATAS
jgi:hypothetical protein